MEMEFEGSISVAGIATIVKNILGTVFEKRGWDRVQKVMQ